MTKKIKKYFTPMFLLLIVTLVFVFNVTDVFSQEQVEGNYCLGLNIDIDEGFPVSSVTVNDNPWASGEDRFYGNIGDDHYLWTIIIKAGKNGDLYPFVSTPGGLVVDDPNDPEYPGYGFYQAIPNLDDNPEIIGDEYVFTIILKDTWPSKGDNTQNPKVCGNYGITITDGPPITAPLQNVTGNISITISGDELEYHYDENHLDVADVTYFKFDINGGTEENHLVPFTFGNAQYTYNDNEAPHNVSSVTTKEPIEYTYQYDGSGFVEFCVNGGGTDEYTSILINGVDYSDRAPHTQVEHFETMQGWAQMFCIPNVPYNEEGYSVVVTGEDTADENKIPGFGWSYLSSDRSEDVSLESEGNFAHGRLEFVSASITIDNEELSFDNVNDFNNFRYHGKGQIFQFNDGLKEYPEEDRRMAWGEAQLPFGTILTVRIVPDEGYQLTSFTSSSNGFQATDTFGVYTLTLNRTNLSYNEDMNQFDLNPVFEQVDGIVISNATNVSHGEISVPFGQNEFMVGSPKLEVSDVTDMSPIRIENFNSAIEEEFEIDDYLEISLYNALFKGGKKDANNNYLSWDTEITTLANNAKASIVLQLEDNVAEKINGKEVLIVHEIHDGDTNVEYEVIAANYNSEEKTISFETGSFSTFAIAIKGENNPVQYTVTFRESDDTELFHMTIDDGGFVERPEDAMHPDESFHFAGWYTTNEYSQEFDFEHTQITNDISIYALWISNYDINGFEVRFDSIGGDPVDTQIVLDGEYATEPNPAPTKEGYIFEGWYLDDEFLEKFDFAKIKITDNIDLIAHWVRDIQNPENYSVEDDFGNIIEFVEETGHTFTLNILGFMSLSKEDVMSLIDISSSEYDQYLDATRNAVKSSGTLIDMYGIELIDDITGESVEDGPLTIKIKLTDEMKKYDTLKLIYVDDDNGFKTQTPITLTVEGDYAVGTLKHLSFYAMAGSNNTSNNPKTNDNIMFYVSVFGLSVIGLVGTAVYLKKKKIN